MIDSPVINEGEMILVTLCPFPLIAQLQGDGRSGW